MVQSKEIHVFQLIKDYLLQLLMNYQEMDQTSWVCYQFESNTYYYGEVGYLDESGVVNSKDNNEAASNPKNKLVKHGFGVYIYNATPNAEPSKYEGLWDKDRKQGQGKLTVPYQFTYEGGFKDGCYHEQGKMIWNNGNSYEGIWKKNKMDGPGLFKHHEGFILKGSFKSNFFIDDNILRSPLMSEKQYIAFKKQRKEVLKQKQKNQKIQHGFVVKVQNQEALKITENSLKSNKNNRIPLIIASESSKITLRQLTEVFEKQGSKVNIFDLRKAYVLKGEERYNYKANFAEITRSTLANGEVLMISLDESDENYKEAFYPDLKQFYDSQGFTSSTWSRDLVRRKQVSSKVIGESEVSENYQIVVWSKVKISEHQSEDRVREKLQLRFETILPFIKIDVIFVTNGKK